VFASKTDMASAFSAELCGFMTVIEIAAARGWRNLWIEQGRSWAWAEQGHGPPQLFFLPFL
jgi:hypothetical protein